MKFLLALAFIIFFYPFNIQSQLYKWQPYRKQSLTKQESSNGVFAKYIMVLSEGHNELILYKNKRFHYEAGHHITTVCSDGKWSRAANTIILNSDIDSTNVPVKAYYFDTDTIRTVYSRTPLYSDTNPPHYTTRIQEPVNLKGQLLLSSRVFINNDSTFCFPYFDTCIGNVAVVQRIKVDFGWGFKSQWMPVFDNQFKRLLVVAQVDFMVGDPINEDAYISLRRYRLKVRGKILTPVNAK